MPGDGGGPVIAVDLNTDRLGHHLKPVKVPRKHIADEPETLADAVMVRIQAGMSQLGINHEAGPRVPAMLDVVASSINIMQVRITRSRLAGDPPDVMVAPLLAEIELMGFHRASVAIDAGRRAAEAVIPQLLARLEGDNG